MNNIKNLLIIPKFKYFSIFKLERFCLYNFEIKAILIFKIISKKIRIGKIFLDQNQFNHESKKHQNL